MISILIISFLAIVCLMFAVADVIENGINMETWLLLFFGYFGVAVAAVMIGHDLALWSLT